MPMGIPNTVTTADTPDLTQLFTKHRKKTKASLQRLIA